MKKLIDAFILLCLLSAPVLGQNMNPQTNFAAQEQVANPSLLLNFNDLTASFKDSISGLSFGSSVQGTAGVGTSCVNGPVASAATTSCVLTTTAGDALIVFVSDTTSSNIASLVDSGGATATEISSSGSTSVWYFSNVTAASHTITLNLNTAVGYPVLQATDVVRAPLTAPIDASNINTVTTTSTAWTSGSITTTASSNELLVGFILGPSNTYALASPIFTAETHGSWTGIFQATYATPSIGSYAFTGTMANSGYVSVIVAVKSAVYTSGTVVTQQAGFDATNAFNYSAAFPYNGFARAANNTLGAIEWSTPWTMLLHIDRLNWNRTGTLVLASKGDISSTANNWWKLTLAGPGNAPGNTQLCFARNGANGTGAPFGNSGDSICTNYDLTNGYNYDILITNNGVGSSAPGSCLSCSPSLGMYINGLNNSYAPTASVSQTYNFGFGAVWETVAAGGTGYANSTAFTVTGGGPNCSVTGTAVAVSGTITSISSPAGQNDFGCTSIPTIVLTSPTGTGASFTVHLAGASMNATNLPLMIPGAVSAGVYNGIDQSDSTQVATNVDEFAIFPGVLSATNIQSLYYLTDFYQGVIGTTPQHIPVIVNEIVCADYDSTTTIAVAIRLHQLGYINLLGVGIESDSGIGAVIFRQMLDQAGLSHIPLAMASNSNLMPTAAGGFCLPANVAAYNASTPQSYTGYPTTASMYRQIFAAHPTTAITLQIPTALFGIYDFMTSAADSISPLTGAQLWNQNVTNGGSMYLEGGPDCESSTLPVTTPCSSSVSGDNSLEYPPQAQYVLSHLAGLPVYLLGGSPAPSGPGPLVTRTSKDPLYLASVTNGTDSRTAWDSLGTMMMFTGVFQGGVQIRYSGGTGYANATAFTSTGGGVNCHVDGYMMASGGVPNGIKTSWGSNYALGTWLSYGHGCTSAPTIVLTAPAGTGVTLTAYPSNVCGTDTITQTNGVWADSFNSATCSNQYVAIPSWQAAMPSSGGSSPVYQWLLNSLQNPVPMSQPKVQ